MKGTNTKRLLSTLLIGGILATAGAQERMDVMWGTQDKAKTGAPSVRGQRFTEGHYAMFIHWGLFSHLANRWKGKTYYGIGEWMMNEGMAGADRNEYMAVAREFNPSAFDAAHIARLAKAAGMRYIVITSKHHDGFSMFRTTHSAFNVVDATPFGRDPMKELAEACRKEGLGFGFYYSHNQDWTTPGGSGGPTTDAEGRKQTFDDYFRKKCLPQVEELTRNYGDIELIWFDTPGGMPEKYARQLVETVHRNQPGALVSGRVGYNLGDYRTLGDMEVPLKNVDGLWESVDVTNDAWGYAWYDKNWKTPAFILRTLLSTVARGGTYMLNIGPDGLGRVPEDVEYTLRRAGEWIARYPEAVYGAGSSPWKHALPWGDAVVTSDGRLLLTVYEWPETGRLFVPGLQSKPRTISLREGKKRRKLKFTQHAGGVSIALPPRKPEAFVNLIEVSTGDSLRVDGTLAVDPEFGLAGLSVAFARAEGCHIRKDSWMEKFGEWKHEYCTSDLHAGGYVEWTVDVDHPQTFQVSLRVRGNGKRVWRVESSGGNIVQNQQNSAALFTEQPIGWLRLAKKGRQTLRVRLMEGGAADLSSITLRPVEKETIQ